jgi:hypothetical protein
MNVASQGKLPTIVSATLEERAMIGTRASVGLAAIAALGVLATSASATDRDRNRERGGFVQPCSLDGVNPVHHPEIFGNAASAASYGFVQTADHRWHVRADCRR